MAANKERGETALKIGDDTYKLRFGWNQIAEVEDLLGVSFFSDVLPKFKSPMSIRASEWRALFWAALRGGGHDKLTLLEAGDLLGEIDIAEVGVTLGEAVARSFPDAEAAEAKNPQ